MLGNPYVTAPSIDAGSRGERLSLLDASFLYLEQPTELLHVGAVTIVEGEVPFETLAAALATRLGGIPRYRERPRRPFLDLAMPSWERDPAFDPRRHIRRVTLPAPAGEAELHRAVDQLFATPLDARHPLWESYVIEGMAGRTADPLQGASLHGRRRQRRPRPRSDGRPERTAAGRVGGTARAPGA